MDNVCLVKSVLDLTGFDLAYRLCHIHCNCSGFRVRHETFWSEYTSETSYNAHHIRCCNNYVEVKPSFILDLRDQLVSSYKISSCCFCFLSLCVLCKYKDADFLTCSVWKYNRTTDLLICVTSVTTCSDMSLDRLVKLCYCCFLNKCYCFIFIVEVSSLDQFRSFDIFLFSFHFTITSLWYWRERSPPTSVS